MTTMPHYVYIETVGCQMNVLDSEMVVASLRQHGYQLVDSIEQADTILFNTCSVRQHAEDKIYSALGHLRRHKQRHPEKVIGVLGCMAQKDQRLIFERAPYVDLVIGPGQLQQTAELIEAARAGGGQQLAVSLGRRDGPVEQIRRSHETFDPLRDPAMRPTPFQAYLRIQIGCDKFCTYCVVPMTRGPEQGRPPDQIVAEARVLADQGCKEITLLGQTVNSYRYRSGGRTTRLADLLVALHEIEGIPAEIRHELPEGHDRRSAANRARPAQVLPLLARAPAKRLESHAAGDETRVHGRGLPGDDGPNPGTSCPTLPCPATLSWVSAVKPTRSFSSRST